MNRRNWLVRVAGLSAGSSFGARINAQSVLSHLPVRSDFPITEKLTFLNNARWHPLSSGAVEAVRGYLQEKATASTRIANAPTGRRVKEMFAKLINAQPSEISFVPSTLVAENLILAGMGVPQELRTPH